MKKRIVASILTLLLLVMTLPTGIFAAGGVQLTVTPSKTSATAGEEIEFTVKISSDVDVETFGFKYDIPEGLTYVEDSTVFDKERIKTVTGATDDVSFTPSSRTVVVASVSPLSGLSDLEIVKFKCKVSDTATGSYSVKLKGVNVVDENDELIDSSAITVNPGTLTITAPTVNVTGVTLDKDSLSLTASGSETLTATVNPNNATNRAVTWSSDNEAVATVDNTGKVIAVARGNATITVTTEDGGFTATCAVTVNCAHSAKTPVPEKASTCTEQGNDAYKKCDTCGQLFNMSDVAIDAIPKRALANHTTTPHDAVPATCTTTGSIEYYECSVCNNKFEDEAGSTPITGDVTTVALGHDYTEGIADDAHKRSTATNCQEHDTYWYDCSRCDANAKNDTAATDMWYTSTNAGSHSYATAWTDYGTAGHAHKCQYCDAHDELLAHNPGPAATEDTPQTCTDCGYVIAPPLGHTHSVQETHEVNATTCTTAGNERYYVCSCGKWFSDDECKHEITDKNSVIHPALGHDWKKATCTEPKTCQRRGCGATEGDPLGHNPGEEWKSNELHHWHICTRCNEKLDNTQDRHNPDRAAATVNDPILCRECGYKLAEKLPAVTVKIPFTVTVKQGGNVAPGKQTFELEIFNIGDSVEEHYANVTYTATVETDGKGDYPAKLVITGSADELAAFTGEGFYVREKNTKAEGWEYSDAVWHVMFDGDAAIVTPATAKTTDNGVEYEDGAAVENGTMTFVNTYTANKTVTPPTTPENPKTADSGMILWVALVLVSGTAVVGATAYSRKKRA